MKKTLLATTLATITLISTSSAFAADSVDLSVGGTIAPVACVPTLSGGGIIDYGDIKADTLSKNDYTTLPKKTLDIAITCDGMTMAAVHAINNRIGSVGVGRGGDIAGDPASYRGDSTANYVVVGLGMDGNTKIGSYRIFFNSKSVMIDNQDTPLIKRKTPNWIPGASAADWSWQIDLNNDLYSRGSDNAMLSWGNKNIPISFKTMTGTLAIEAYIAKTSVIDLTKPIKLDGSTTLELVYL